jgi:hypothetical protein
VVILFVVRVMKVEQKLTILVVLEAAVPVELEVVEVETVKTVAAAYLPILQDRLFLEQVEVETMQALVDQVVEVITVKTDHLIMAAAEVETKTLALLVVADRELLF